MIKDIVIAILMVILLVRYVLDIMEYFKLDDHSGFKRNWKIYATPYVIVTLLLILIGVIWFAFKNEYTVVESENHDIVGCIKTFGFGRLRSSGNEWDGKQIEKALGVPVEDFRHNYPMSKGEMTRKHGKFKKVCRGIYKFVN